MILPTPDAYTFLGRLSPEYEEEITQKLIDHNRAHSPLWEQNHDGRFSPEPLHIYVRDAEGQVIGGLVGRTHALRSWLEISLLWIDPPHRRQGLGRELMARAESESRRRGCLYARLSTGRHQAPEFYEKLGYILYGKLENCPPGDTSFYYWKSLGL
jgi:GNAT superfamily N-acetyltransferase